MENEEWRWIEKHEGRYQVSSLGRVRSFVNRTEPLVLKFSTEPRGYQRLCLAPGHQNEWVHRLVAKAFIPNEEAKLEVNHLDNNPSNNKVENLAWVTHRENMKHSWTQGRSKRPPSMLGEKAYAAVMTADDVRRIRSRYQQGDISYDQLAHVYNVSKFCIYAIVTRKNWAHII